MVRQSTQIWCLLWIPPVVKLGSQLRWDSSHFATHCGIGHCYFRSACQQGRDSPFHKLVHIPFLQSGMSLQKALLASEEGSRNFERKLRRPSRTRCQSLKQATSITQADFWVAASPGADTPASWANLLWALHCPLALQLCWRTAARGVLWCSAAPCWSSTKSHAEEAWEG